jgi:dTDP-4-amino-4,6-dideoxygalactose transaminase
VPSWTFTATAEVVCLVGATPVFVDVDLDTLNLSPESLRGAIRMIREDGTLTPKLIIPVDLFGLPAAYNEILAIAAAHRLWVICDAAQSFGAVYKCRKIGTLGDITTTSFFPAKPLGCYGDGGAVFTDDDALAARVKSLRVHGENAGDKYDALHIGLTGRLDSIQAAVLIEKLKIFADEIVARQAVAARYAEGLAGVTTTPRTGNESTSVWAQYTIRLEPGRRDALGTALKAQGIPTAIYYAKPLHRQAAYRHYPVADGGVPVSDRLAEEVISLPMHAYLEPAVQDRIIEAVRRALAG